MTIKVQDIIEYLTKNFKLDAEVCLDNDGWSEEELKPTSEQDLIKKRGIFEDYDGTLFINN